MSATSTAVKFVDESVRSPSSNSSSEQVHYLPFKIQHDGQVENITTRFSNQIFHDKDSNVDQNYFRGRSIQGNSIELTDNYEGLLVMEEKIPINSMQVLDDNNDVNANGTAGSGNEKTVTIKSKFDKFTYWNWDMKPTAMDAPVKLKDWLELAQTLHEPSEMDLDSEDSVPVISVE